MSYARKVRRTRNRDAYRQAITAASAIRGCTCRPDLEHSTRDGLAWVDVWHDHDCLADTTRGPSLLVARKHGQSDHDFARDVLRIVDALREEGYRI